MGGPGAERLREIYLESRKVAYHWLPPEQFRLEDFEPDTEGEEILVGEEKAVDHLEAQLHQIGEIGRERYLAELIRE